MIRIKFKEPVTKIWTRWLSDCNKATSKLKKAYGPDEPIEIIERLYRRTSIKKTVYIAKDGPFRGRCAYCETDIADFQHGDIEHYRPKLGVTDMSNNPVVTGMSGLRQLYHRGYYWLAYNWKNLLASCSICNQPGEEGIGKHNRFPIKDNKYAITAEEIESEKPLLFNPTDPDDENPEDHLGIDLDTGLLTKIDESERAAACIEVFGLNKREQLVKNRREAMGVVKAQFTEYIYATGGKVDELRQELVQAKQGYFSYTLARRAQLRELERRFKGVIDDAV